MIYFYDFFLITFLMGTLNGLTDLDKFLSQTERMMDTKTLKQTFMSQEAPSSIVILIVIQQSTTVLNFVCMCMRVCCCCVSSLHISGYPEAPSSQARETLALRRAGIWLPWCLSVEMEGRLGN